jgi:hypothetical protein
MLLVTQQAVFGTECSGPHPELERVAPQQRRLTALAQHSGLALSCIRHGCGALNCGLQASGASLSQPSAGP